MAQKLTDNTTDDAGVVSDLLDRIPDDKKIARFTGDGAYDQSSIYETFAELGARVVVPPVKTTVPSRAKPRAAKARNRTVNRIKKVGRRQWKNEARYHRQKTPSSDTSNSSEADCAHATQAINEPKPNSPATYSTSCSSSGHQNLRRSETERERREGISAEFDLCNNAAIRFSCASAGPLEGWVGMTGASDSQDLSARVKQVRRSSGQAQYGSSSARAAAASYGARSAT